MHWLNDPLVGCLLWLNITAGFCYLQHLCELRWLDAKKEFNITPV